MKKLLFRRDSSEIEKLRDLIEKQKHRTLVAWVIDCSEAILAIFESRHGDDPRPRQAIQAARSWAVGDIKMPAAQQAALASHRAATEALDDLAACAAARAMGHVVGTVHVETHALGFVIYGLTAIARNNDSLIAEKIADECRRLYDRLIYWEREIETDQRPWAPFLLREDQPNKEKLLHDKESSKVGQIGKKNATIAR
ncbi:MAG: hypothetical protein V1761_00810 [bacterium]